jgi:hypothetical protein
MLYIPSLLTILLRYLVAAVSPGPSFFVISQLSLSGKKAQATQVALGISTWARLFGRFWQWLAYPRFLRQLNGSTQQYALLVWPT